MTAEPVRRQPFPLLVQGTEPPGIEWKEYPRIPPGEYQAYCRWGKHYRDPGFHRWLCLLRWDVFADGLSHLIACVPQFFPLGGGDKPPSVATREVLSRVGSGQRRTTGARRSPLPPEYFFAASHAWRLVTQKVRRRTRW
jgi:hypothetical protein